MLAEFAAATLEAQQDAIKLQAKDDLKLVSVAANIGFAAEGGASI